MPGSVFDINDQAALTEVINRRVTSALDGDDVLGRSIAPMFDVQDRVIKMETIEAFAYGKGQFKAPDATPALYSPRIKITEEGIELALLEEMTVVKESLYMKLTSSDDAIRRAAGADLISRATALQLRNEVLTEWMRWQAFQGQLVIRYPNDNQTIVLNYPGVYKPQSGTPWTNRASATPITDLRTWQKLTANGPVGALATMIHMNSDTWEELQFSQQVRDYLTDGSRDVYLPETADVLKLLRAGTQFVIYDQGYHEESAGTDRSEQSKTQFIPDGYVLLTTPYVVQGERIADMANGLVSVPTAFNQLESRQGPQSVQLVDAGTSARMWVQKSARIPRIRRPQAFVWAKVF